MMKFQTRKSKSTQYAIGGTVAVIILALWISLPMMSGSPMDSSVSMGNPFRSKVADISSLGSDIPSEGGAPGSPLSGEMINNPVTSGEEVASSLFQSGAPGDELAEASASAAVNSASALAPASSAGAPASQRPRAKLNAAASITGGNSNSMTAGGVHNKFFGSGNQKAEFAPSSGPDLKNMSGAEKKSSLAAMLAGSSEKSQLAAKTGNLDAARGGAASAFANTAKTGTTGRNDDLENKVVESGLQLGQTAQDLKRNDPSLSKTKVVPPSEPEEAVDEDEEFKNEIKMMIIRAMLNVALGMFGVPAAA